MDENEELLKLFTAPEWNFTVCRLPDCTAHLGGVAKSLETALMTTKRALKDYQHDNSSQPLNFHAVGIITFPCLGYFRGQQSVEYSLTHGLSMRSELPGGRWLLDHHGFSRNPIIFNASGTV